MKSWSWWCCLVAGAWLVGSAGVHAADLPALRREFRAAWIATVANIDWPSKPGLPADRQRAELATLLDRAADTGLNAVILQVRPCADADSHDRAVATGGLADCAAWRRDNVDRLVERLWREVKELKPHVLVGISPFDIWRPGHPPEIKGLDQVAALNADPRKCGVGDLSHHRDVQAARRSQS